MEKLAAFSAGTFLFTADNGLEVLVKGFLHPLLEPSWSIIHLRLAAFL